MIYTSIWAHRGASAYVPENTMAAFIMAHKLGADGIELDVHMTADEVIVVCHDSDIKRTSDGWGAIEGMTYEQLLSYDFGYPSVFGERFKGTKISTLKEVYRAIEPTGMVINVELKSSLDGMPQKLLELTRECGIQERVIYSSFDFEYLKQIKALDANAYIAPLFGDTQNPCGLANLLGAVAIHPSYTTASREEYIDEAHKAGIRVHTWTVNTPEAMAFLIENRADALITNYPDIAKEIRDDSLRSFR